MERQIKQLLVDIKNDTHIFTATETKPITRITKNGEMALVDWYKIGEKQEINGRYVISIVYV